MAGGRCWKPLLLALLVAALCCEQVLAFSVSPATTTVSELSQVVLQGMNPPEDATYAFQWLHDGAPLDPDVNPSAASQVLVIETILANEAGTYVLRATATNGNAVVDSSPATVMVNFAPRILQQPP
ncbi:hypothetical protein PTSG_11516 [Salpingoeca rosetta]|uniref:Ig-like domain-containing protein n=1 Tax=Salpingoeca rosetta (strain ATCC 50818 / BSB-021) TaxID=946362 RepID=F2UTQ5_SALR5|nr:uncharacterized protein PTSG_11516 [Salpingoeca rosetta]EGD74418.1 hypothetical protein PTSG_11516 [Salpingoeca rosetta]|eukprot:XP_004987448.1 hypothetical protein PTSG_11516 [Salpingoeca rosetta]